MRNKLFGVAVLFSMLCFPGTWVEAYGAESFRHATEILKNIVFA